MELSGGHDVKGQSDPLGLKVLLRPVGVDRGDVLVGDEQDAAPGAVDVLEVGAGRVEDVVEHDERVVELLGAFDMETVLGRGDRGRHVGAVEAVHFV